MLTAAQFDVAVNVGLDVGLPAFGGSNESLVWHDVDLSVLTPSRCTVS
jgi:hypothetical protein